MENPADEKPFVLRTAGNKDVEMRRGLEQLAQVIEIAYSLFTEPFFTKGFGDPFISIKKNDPEIYQRFNRTIIERTVAESHYYGNISFSGEFLTVSSPDIESYIEDLDIIWTVIDRYKLENKETLNSFGQYPEIFKVNSRAKLFALLQYFLDTNVNLISQIRTRQLKEKLEATPYQEKKHLLLRTKTDLKIQKHQIESIVAELIRVIDLELEMLNELGNPQAENIKTAPYNLNEKKPNTLPVNVETDLKYDLSIFSFPFRSFFDEDMELMDDLKEEFALLLPEPKLHWYFNQFISDDEWAEYCTTGKWEPGSHIKETNARKIQNDFAEMVLNQNVDHKYYGRNLKDTQIVQNLQKLSLHIKDFKEYAFTNVGIETFSDYAKAASKSIALLVDKFQNVRLRSILLQMLVDMSIQEDITIIGSIGGKSQQEIAEFSKRFNILKVYSKEVFVAELDKLYGILAKKNKTEYKTIFKNPQNAQALINVLRKVIPPVIGEKNQFILGPRKKGAIVCWLDIVSKKGETIEGIPPERKAQLLNEIFPGLSVTGRTLRNFNQSTSKQYFDDLHRLIAKI